MNNIQQFSSKKSIQEQACDWISKIDRGLNSEEVESFLLWVNTSEAHRQSLFAVAKTWDDLSILNQLSGLITPEQLPKPARYQSHKHKTLAMAASVVFFCVCFISVYSSWRPTNTLNDALTFNLNAETIVGEQRVISLTDGSTIHLNTNSRVNVTFSQNARDIQLIQGEAFFDVAHDAERPFVVRSGGKTVTAVGTAFNVQLTQNDNFELLVTDGKVLVNNSRTPEYVSSQDIDKQPAPGTLLLVGQKALVSSKHIQRLSVDAEQSQQELAWQQGMLVFHGEPLELALKEISRYTSVNFTLADDQVKQRRVAGYFKANDVQGLLFALENNFNIVHKKQDDNTILLASGT